MQSANRIVVAVRALVALVFLASLGGLGRLIPVSSGALLTFLILLLLPAALAPTRGTSARRAIVGYLRTHWFPVGLSAVVVFGLAVRLVDIGHGLGHWLTDIDENRLAESVRHFLTTGTIDHSTVEHYPGLHFWMLTGSFLLTYLWGLMSGVALRFAEFPTEWFVWAGRVTNAFLEAGTIALTGLLGRAVAGPGVGLAAAFIVAISPLSLSIGIQLRSDTALAFFATASVLVAVTRGQRPGWTGPLAGGLLAGCTAAVKYSGVFALLPVLIAAALSKRGTRRLVQAGIAVVGFGVALAATNHFIWADMPNFVNQLATEVSMTGAAHWAATANPGWFYARILAVDGVGWPLLVIAVLYVAVGLATPNRTVWLLVSFPAAYVWFMTAQPAQFARWVYPLTPCVAVAAASGVAWLAGAAGAWLERGWPQRRRLKRAIVALVVAAPLAPLVAGAATAIGWRFRAPTYALAEAWLRERAQKQDRVLSELGMLDFSGSDVRVVRVPDLAPVLGGGDYELQAYDWIVVPEDHFGDPQLARLNLAGDFTASWTLGGNRGLDFRIYTPPPLKPLESPAIELGAPEAAAALGRQWMADDRQAPGLAVPSGGASLFLPLPRREPLRLEFELVERATLGDADAVPLALTIEGRNVPLERVASAATRTGPAAGRSVLRSAPVPLDLLEHRVTTMVVEPTGRASGVRVVKVVIL